MGPIDRERPMSEVVAERENRRLQLQPVERPVRTDRLLSVRLEPELYDRLQGEADRVGITVSEAVRQLIRALVDETDREVTEVPKVV